MQLGSTMNDAPIHSYPSYMRYQSNFYPQQPLPVSRMTQQDVNSGSMWFRHSGDEDSRISNYQLSVSSYVFEALETLVYIFLKLNI